MVWWHVSGHVFNDPLGLALVSIIQHCCLQPFGYSDRQSCGMLERQEVWFAAHTVVSCDICSFASASLTLGHLTPLLKL